MADNELIITMKVNGAEATTKQVQKALADKEALLIKSNAKSEASEQAHQQKIQDSQAQMLTGQKRWSQQMTEGVNQLNNAFKVLGATVVGAFAVGAIKSAFSNMIEYAKNLKTMSNTLDLSTKSFESFYLMAKKTASQEDVFKWLEKLNVGLQAFTSGDLSGDKLGKYLQGLSAIGFNAVQTGTGSINSEELFKKVFEYLKGGGSENEVTKLGIGARQIGELTRAAKSGKSWEDVQSLATSNEKALTAINEFASAMGSIKQNILVGIINGLGPELPIITERLKEFGKKLVDLVVAIPWDKLIWAVGALADTLAFAIKHIMSIINVSSINRITTTLTNPLSGTSEHLTAKSTNIFKEEDSFAIKMHATTKLEFETLSKMSIKNWMDMGKRMRNIYATTFREGFNRTSAKTAYIQAIMKEELAFLQETYNDLIDRKILKGSKVNFKESAKVLQEQHPGKTPIFDKFKSVEKSFESMAESSSVVEMGTTAEIITKSTNKFVSALKSSGIGAELKIAGNALTESFPALGKMATSMRGMIPLINKINLWLTAILMGMDVIDSGRAQKMANKNLISAQEKYILSDEYGQAPKGVLERGGFNQTVDSQSLTEKSFSKMIEDDSKKNWTTGGGKTGTFIKGFSSSLGYAVAKIPVSLLKLSGDILGFFSKDLGDYIESTSNNALELLRTGRTSQHRAAINSANFRIQMDKAFDELWSETAKQWLEGTAISKGIESNVSTENTKKEYKRAIALKLETVPSLDKNNLPITKSVKGREVAVTETYGKLYQASYDAEGNITGYAKTFTKITKGMQELFKKNLRALEGVNAPPKVKTFAEELQDEINKLTDSTLTANITTVKEAITKNAGNSRVIELLNKKLNELEGDSDLNSVLEKGTQEKNATTNKTRRITKLTTALKEVTSQSDAWYALQEQINKENKEDYKTSLDKLTKQKGDNVTLIANFMKEYNDASNNVAKQINAGILALETGGFSSLSNFIKEIQTTNNDSEIQKAKSLVDGIITKLNLTLTDDQKTNLTKLYDDLTKKPTAQKNSFESSEDAVAKYNIELAAAIKNSIRYVELSNLIANEKQKQLTITLETELYNKQADSIESVNKALVASAAIRAGQANPAWMQLYSAQNTDALKKETRKGFIDIYNNPKSTQQQKQIASTNLGGGGENPGFLEMTGLVSPENVTEVDKSLQKANAIMQSGMQIFTAFDDLKNAGYQREIEHIQKIIDLENERWASSSESMKEAGLQSTTYFRNEQREHNKVLFEQTKKMNAIQADQFDSEKSSKEIGVLMNGAMAITSAWTLGPIVGAISTAAILAMTAAQYAIIEGQENPYRRALGGWIPGMGNMDSQHAVLTPGEYVVNRSAAQQNASILERINAGENIGGGSSTINVNVNGNIVGTQSFVEDVLVPSIRKAVRGGHILND